MENRIKKIAAAILPHAFLFASPFIAYLAVWAVAGPDAKHFFGDTFEEYWPDLAYIYNAFSEGSFPLWSPYERGGWPFCCDPQAGVLYPVNWILVAVGYLLGGVSYQLLQVKILLHLSIAGISMAIFLRGLKLPSLPALAGGIAYQLGPFMLVHAHFSLIWPAAWMPLVLYFTDRLFKNRTIADAVLLAIFVGMATMAGSPPTVFYGFLVAGPYFVMRLVEYLRSEGLKDGISQLWLPLAVSLACAAIFVLPVVLPTAVVTGHSIRESRTFGYAAGGGIEAKSILGLVLKGAYGRYLYAGVCVVLLALLGVVKWKRRGLAVFFAAIAVFGFLLALGDRTHLFRVLYTVFPPFNLFRIANRYIYVVNFALPVLAAGGLAAVMDREVNCRRFLAAAAIFTGFFSLLAIFFQVAPQHVSNDTLLNDMWWLVIIASLTMASLRIAISAPGKKGVFAFCVVAILFIDLSTVGRRSGVLEDGRFRENTGIFEKVKKLTEKENNGYRVYNEFLLGLRPGSLISVRDFRGYMGPLRGKRFDNVIKMFHTSPELASVFNIKYILHAPHKTLKYSHHHIKEPQKIPGVKKIDKGIFQLPDPDPFAYWVGRVKLVENDARALGALKRLDRVKECVFAKEDLDGDQLRLASDFKDSPPRGAAVKVIEANVNEVHLQVDAPGKGFVVLNEAWFPGWRATVDGDRVDVLRANSILQAVFVGPGRHSVVFRFRPMYFLVPACLCLRIIAAIVALYLVPSARKHIFR
ncbi:MAG: hypothetical protein ABIJ56_11095 [Pseudomonadota bacterium]